MDHHRLLFFFFVLLLDHSEAQSVGVNYGLLGDNLPAPDSVIALMKSRNIQKIRIFYPNSGVLRALQGSGIQVILGVRNQDLQQLSTDTSFAASWVNTNVIPYTSTVRFRYISAGNEVIPGPLSAYVLPAMQNLDTALKAAGLTIPVTTCVFMQVLGSSSFPPSQGTFSAEAASDMVPITRFLEANKSPLLANIYPYFAYAGDPKNMQLDYALLTSKTVVTVDGSLQYTNLFDAMVDTLYSSLEKVGGPNVDIVVAETGWPSAGNGDIATITNARTYINNLVAHVSSGSGTPRRPGRSIETYLFAMFNENKKPEGTEQNFGIYYPDMTEVYHVNFA